MLHKGGGSGIGRSAAVHLAREGAKGVAIVYNLSEENQDAKETVRGGWLCFLAVPILNKSCSCDVESTLRVIVDLIAS